MIEELKSLLNSFIVIPIRGIHVSSKQASTTGFKNILLSGILVNVTENNVHLADPETGEVHTIIPITSVGAYMTTNSDLYERVEVPYDEKDIN